MDFKRLEIQLNEEEDLNLKNTVISAGIIFKFKNKILMIHPTNGRFKKGWNFPKGKVDPGETIIDGAIREVEEEVSIKVSKKDLEKCPRNYIEYPAGGPDKGKTKRFYFYLMEIKSLDDIGLKEEKIPKSKLQLKEVDIAQFIELEKVIDLLPKSMEKILDFIS